MRIFTQDKPTESATPVSARELPKMDRKVGIIALAIIGAVLAVGLGVGVGFLCHSVPLGVGLGISIGTVGIVIAAVTIKKHIHDTERQNALLRLESQISELYTTENAENYC